MVIWRLPEAIPPSGHPYKYRLVFVRDGKRVVGYNNERGKGDHKHFVDEGKLLDDFWRDVMEASNENP